MKSNLDDKQIHAQYAWIWTVSTGYGVFQFQTQANGELTLLVHCLFQMLPLNHKRTTSSLAPPFFVAKKLAIKRQKAPHLANYQTSQTNIAEYKSGQNGTENNHLAPNELYYRQIVNRNKFLFFHAQYKFGICSSN